MTTTNQEKPIIISQINVCVIKTIFQWYSTDKKLKKNSSSHSHCLLRIYRWQERQKAVIIASELHSNNNNTGVYRGYEDLATSIVKKFEQLKPILGSTIWLTQAGQVSYPLSWSETGHKDTFRQILLEFDSNYEAHKKSSQQLELKEIIKMLEGTYLESAVEVLEQLKHDNGWDGIVDQYQVEACQELEEGIVLGQKRRAGLVGW